MKGTKGFPSYVFLNNCPEKPSLVGNTSIPVVETALPKVILLALGQYHIAITVHGEIFAFSFFHASISAASAMKHIFLIHNIVDINIAVIQIIPGHELPGMGKAELEDSQPK